MRELLQPHYAPMGLFLTPIIVSTSPGHRGGLVSYAKVRPQIEKLCKQDANAHVSSMFDLYALPSDFPGRAAGAWPHHGSGHQKATFAEKQLAQDISQGNFIPNIMWCMNMKRSCSFNRNDSPIGRMLKRSKHLGAHVIPMPLKTSTTTLGPRHPSAFWKSCLAIRSHSMDHCWLVKSALAPFARIARISTLG